MEVPARLGPYLKTLENNFVVTDFLSKKSHKISRLNFTDLNWQKEKFSETVKLCVDEIVPLSL